MASLPSLDPAALNAGLQSIGILFNAAGIAAGGLGPPFRTKLQDRTPSLPGSVAPDLDLLIIDATLQETHSAQAEVTEHPVEVGSDITDHIRPRPVEVRIDGVITASPLNRSALLQLAAGSPLGPNSPLGLGAGLGVAGGEAAVLAILGKASILKDAFSTLRKIRDTAQLVIIATPYEQYENMAMTDLQVVRDQHTGDSLRFQATFRQIVTVEGAQTVTRPAMAQDSFDAGTQSTTEASGAVKKSSDSILYQMNPGGVVDALKGYISPTGAALPPRQ